MLRGFATYYGPGLVNRRTAYGEMLDDDALTCAMVPERAPKNAKVKVTLETDPSRTVTVRVNDTGPYARGADGVAAKPLTPDPDTIVDLTVAAFRKLNGSLDAGKVKVTVEVVE